MSGFRGFAYGSDREVDKVVPSYYWHPWVVFVLEQEHRVSHDIVKF